MSSLTIDAVGKTYGSFRAIANVSIDVTDGEFLVLVDRLAVLAPCHEETSSNLQQVDSPQTTLRIA